LTLQWFYYILSLIMKDEICREIESILKNNYGATKVLVDTEYVFVYGVDVDYAMKAVSTLLKETHTVLFQRKDVDKKECVFQIVKKV